MMKAINKSNIVISVLLCIPLIFIVYLFAVYTSHNASAEDIYQVKVTSPDGTETTFSDTADIGFYLDAMLDATKVSKPLRNIEDERDRALIVGYRKLDKQTDYILFPSTNANECFFLNPDGDCLVLPEDTAQKLLVRKELDFIYENSSLPGLYITASGIKSNLQPVSYEWHYKKSDGTFYDDTKTPLRGEVTEYELNADMTNLIEFSTSPDSVKTTVYNEDNTVVYQTDSANISQLSFATDMKLRITVSAEWLKKENSSEYGSASYEIYARYDIPAKFTLSAEDAKPGDVILLSASFLADGEVVAMETNLNTSGLIFFGTGAKRTALIPISSANAPGVYSMTLKAGGRDTVLNINLTDSGAKVHHINPTKTLSETANSNFKNMLTTAFSKTASSPYISSGVAFFKPITSDVKYSYADELFYDPSPAIVYSYGNYYTVDAGTSAKAAEKGKVVFADENEITGKTVIIDHGNGIQTVYAHLKSISVTLNANVVKGSEVGKTGNSGYTTENSFMFCVTVNGVLVNPNNALESGIIFE